VTLVVEELMELNALYRLRSAQGVIGLADKHGAERLEAACATALRAGDPSYKTIRNILVAGLEDADGPDSSQLPPAAPAHLHGPERLFEIGESR
ncbi:MAG: IS21 family transposase, partial [Acidimicrobiales bacterium]